MKITFINPTLGGDYSALDIAITTLATIINKHSDHEAKILDFTFTRRTWKKKLKKHLKVEEPDIIGFSVNSLYLNHIKKISKEVKKINSSIDVIYGGYHASTKPETLIDLEYVDYVFTGDSEKSIIKFLDSKSNDELGRIPGMWYYNGKKLIRESPRFKSNLNDIPYLDWDLWEDLDKYFYFLGMLYMIGSRGCIYNCSFCETKELRKKVNGSYYRLINPKRFVKEIKYQWEKYKDRNLRLIQIFDQIPTKNKKWLKEFTTEFKKELNPNRCKYSFFSRADDLDSEKISWLSDAGCLMLRVGIESGDEKIRNEVMNKKLSDKKIKEVFTKIKESNINITAYYILGAPSETKDTLNKTLEFAKWIDAERSAFFIFKPFTLQSQELVKKHNGKINIKKKVDNITFDAVVDYKDLKSYEIERFQIKAYLETFSPRLFYLIRKDGPFYFIKLFIYLFKGLIYGLDFKYLITYFHIYAYDYIYE